MFLYTEYLTVVVSSGVNSDLSSVDLLNWQYVSNTGSGCLCNEECHTPGKMTVLEIGNVDFVSTSCSPVLSFKNNFNKNRNLFFMLLCLSLPAQF